MSAPIEDLTPDDLAAIVRFHGANDALDALLTVAAEAYGAERAVTNLHRLLLSRSAHLFAKEN